MKRLVSLLILVVLSVAAGASVGRDSHLPGQTRLTQTRPAQTQPAQTQPTQVVLLGTGTPNADPDASGPAVAIVVNDTPYVIDTGPGVVRRAAAAHQRGVAGLAVSRLRRLFITHLH
ncbi:MAG: hypothetical protein ACK5RS_10905, partial [Acidobacteriota bacterium]